MSVEFIRGARLSDDVADIETVTYLGAAVGPAVAENVKAAVVAGTLAAFAGDFTAQEKEDVLFSLEFADRYASAQHDRFNAVENWYRAFEEALGNTGWLVKEIKRIKKDELKGEVEADKAALAILATAATGAAALAVLQSAIKALEGMSDKDERITLYSHYASRDQAAHIQMGAAEKTDGTITMSFGALSFERDANTTRIPFFRWGDDIQDYFFACNQAVFNTAAYAERRAEVRTRLGAKALDFIRAVPLAD